MGEFLGANLVKGYKPKDTRKDKERGTFDRENYEFENKYGDIIKSLANYNKVDMSTANDMLKTNLDQNNGNYKGGGVIDSDKWNNMLGEYKNLKDIAIKDTSSRDFTDSSGRKVSGRSLIDGSTNVDKSLGQNTSGLSQSELANNLSNMTKPQVPNTGNPEINQALNEYIKYSRPEPIPIRPDATNPYYDNKFAKPEAIPVRPDATNPYYDNKQVPAGNNMSRPSMPSNVNQAVNRETGEVIFDKNNQNLMNNKQVPTGNQGARPSVPNNVNQVVDRSTGEVIYNKNNQTNAASDNAAYSSMVKPNNGGSANTPTPQATTVATPQARVNSSSVSNNKSTEDTILKLINSLPSEVLDYESAKGRADEQFGYEYDKGLEQRMKDIDRQSLQTGFFGQLPTVDYKQRNADDIEYKKQEGIAQLAQQLVDGSKADVQNAIGNHTNYQNDKWNKGFKEKEFSASRSDAAFSQNMQSKQFDASRQDVDWEKAFKTQQYGDSRDDVSWERGFNEQKYTDSRGDVNWEKAFKDRAYVDGRDDTNWEKGFKEQNYTDSRGDVNWEKLFKNQQYGDSRDDANWEKNFNTVKYNDGRTDTQWEKDLKDKTYSDGRTDTQWEKEFKEAGITGIFKNNPTMAMTQLAHNIGMDQQQMAFDEQKLNADLAVKWENIKNDKTKIAQAWTRIGQTNNSQSLDLKKYESGLKEKAFDMAVDELKLRNPQADLSGLDWLDGGTSGGGLDDEQLQKELQVLWGSYSNQLKDGLNTNFDGLYK